MATLSGHPEYLYAPDKEGRQEMAFGKARAGRTQCQYSVILQYIGNINQPKST
jgi:hypothetical protein